MHPVRAAVCESALHVVCDLLDEASEACAEAYARAETCTQARAETGTLCASSDPPNPPNP